MPWLKKNEQNPSDCLFFIHVPRCGGTSLMQAHSVPEKAVKGKSWWHRLGMRLFFERYKLLETTNFPFWTNGNLVALIALLVGLILSPAAPVFSTLLIILSLTLFLSLTFIFTAPTIGRITYIRRSFLILIHYILFKFMESIDWITGANKTGYMNHLTAHKILNYGYIDPMEFELISSMAIVRNPYSRMVSIYMYNRFGNLESFPAFVRSWYNMMKDYRSTGEMEEWFTACHAIPQFEYTHFEGKQLVQSIVKQEELKYLKTREDEHLAIAQDSSVKDLPSPVREALLGMPHTNKRSTKKPWWDYYNQETLDMTYELYQNDFVVFQYSPTLTERPDLQHPAMARVERKSKMQTMQRDSWRESSREFRHSLIMRTSLQRSRRSSMLNFPSDLDLLEETEEGSEFPSEQSRLVGTSRA
jgi:hypothetical protein